MVICLSLSLRDECFCGGRPARNVQVEQGSKSAASLWSAFQHVLRRSDQIVSPGSDLSLSPFGDLFPLPILLWFYHSGRRDWIPWRINRPLRAPRRPGCSWCCLPRSFLPKFLSGSKLERARRQRPQAACVRGPASGHRGGGRGQGGAGEGAVSGAVLLLLLTLALAPLVLYGGSPISRSLSLWVCGTDALFLPADLAHFIVNCWLLASIWFDSFLFPSAVGFWPPPSIWFACRFQSFPCSWIFVCIFIACYLWIFVCIYSFSVLVNSLHTASLVAFVYC